MKKIFVFLFLFSILITKINAQAPNNWEDSVLATFTLDQKIGQLFMISAYSNKDAKHTIEIENAINKYHVGGLIFFQGTPTKQVYLTNYYQSFSKTPLFIAQDAEWGVKMRLPDAPKYPFEMTLGACQNPALSYESGKAMGQELKRMGVHISFSPVADINNNPNNPIIGFRSFGENRENVAIKSVAMAHGLQSEHVIACAKHFPGHGNTSTDSHLDLPIIGGNKQQLDSIELFPFKYAFEGGVISTMVGHIHVPGLDNKANMPASLSPKIVKDVLRYQLNFQGLAFTDAMNMKGVTKFFKNGEAEVMALIADNDIILCPENLEAAFAAIKKAIADGRLSENDINQKVKKILYYKRWAGLNEYSPANISHIEEEIKTIAEQSNVLKEAAEKSITVVNNKGNFVPLNSNSKYALVSIGELGNNEFFNFLQNQINVTKFSIAETTNASAGLKLKSELKDYDSIIISFHNPSIWKSRSYGYSDEVIRLANELERENQTCIVLFCNPYMTKYFSTSSNLIVAYEDEPIFRTTAAEMLLGEKPMIGVLPFKPKTITAPNNIPLSYFTSSGINEYNAHLAGLDTNKLKRIDYVLNEIVYSGSAPGGQVLIAKDGKIVYDKSFGRYTFSSSQLVTPNTMYDVASVTKVYATSLMAMKLNDLGTLSLNETLDKYIPETIGKSVGKIKIKDLMLHQAGLPAWIPFYKATVGDSFNYIYSTSKKTPFLLPVAPNMFMDTGYLSKMMSQIYNIELTSKGSYKYSDLSMILLKKAMENIAGISEDSFVYYNFYKPMGLRHTGFNMYNNFSKDSFAPTEEDRYFRQQTIQGYVHDMGAAMFGGIAGHAGLFSNTTDMFAISEMLRNNGNYNGMSFINPNTIALFSKQQQSGSRRGLIFDKPDKRRGFSSPTSDDAPLVTYGHTGFTGTCVWVDPSNGFVYIFLSNRTYPSQDNKRLVQGNYRDKIQKIMYDAMIK